MNFMSVETIICTSTRNKLFLDMHPSSFCKRPVKPSPKHSDVNWLYIPNCGKRSETLRRILFENRSSRTEQETYTEKSAVIKGWEKMPVVYQNSFPPFLQKCKFVGCKTIACKIWELWVFWEIYGGLLCIIQKLLPTTLHLIQEYLTTGCIF